MVTMDLFSATCRAEPYHHASLALTSLVALTLVSLGSVAGCSVASCDDPELCDYAPVIRESTPIRQSPPPFEVEPGGDVPAEGGTVAPEGSGNRGIVNAPPTHDGNGGADLSTMDCNASTPAAYRDQDGDSFCPRGQDIDGDGCCLPKTPNEVTLVAAEQDCDDTRASVNPNAQERCTNRDDNCNGQIDEDGVCPETCEKREVQGHLFLFCSNALNWDSAQQFCAETGMHLAHIDNVEQDNAFDADLEDGPRGAFWLGGRRDPNNLSHFRWVHGNRHFSTGSSPHEGAYVNWNGGEPNDFREHCVQRRENFSDRGWNDVSCGVRLRFLCRLSE